MSVKASAQRKPGKLSGGFVPVLLCALLVSFPSAIGDERGWPMDGGDPAFTREGTVTAQPAHAWSTKIPTKIDEVFFRFPMLAAGEHVVTWADGVYCFDIRTGNIVWTALPGDGTESGFAFDHGLLIAAEDGGNVSAVAAENGTVMWRQHVGSGTGAGIVVAGQRVAGVAWDGTVFVLNESTGEPLWSATVASETYATPAFVNDALVVADSQGNLSAFRAPDGAPLWHSQYRAGFTAGPMFNGQDIIIGDDSGILRAINASDGSVKWSTALAGGFGVRPIQKGDALVALTVDRPNSTLTRLDAQTGLILWATTRTGDRPWGEPQIYREAILTDYGEGTFEARDVKTGKLLGKSGLRDGGMGEFVFVNDWIVFVESSGIYYTINAMRVDSLIPELGTFGAGAGPPPSVFLILAGGAIVAVTAVASHQWWGKKMADRRATRSWNSRWIKK